MLFLIHLLGSASFGFAIYYDAYVLQLPESVSPKTEDFGGLCKYLTFLNMCLQFVFFVVCLITDFSSPNSYQMKVRNFIFASAAFPIGVFVFASFWTIYAVDRELIFPERLDEHFPSWLNHLMHTTVLPLQIAELCMTRHSFPRRIHGGGFLAFLTLCYLIWVHIIFYYGGFWVYPVFRVLTTVQRVILMIFCCSMAFFFYILGEKINNFILRKQEDKKKY